MTDDQQHILDELIRSRGKTCSGLCSICPIPEDCRPAAYLDWCSHRYLAAIEMTPPEHTMEMLL